MNKKRRTTLEAIKAREQERLASLEGEQSKTQIEVRWCRVRLSDVSKEIQQNNEKERRSLEESRGERRE